MIADGPIDGLCQKVWDGGRIDAAEARRLYDLPLLEFGALADRRRQLAKAGDYHGQGNQIVTYQIDRNINYTNICNVYCKFCAFYRTETDPDAYVITWEEMEKKIAETVAQGGRQILLQGGHHPKLSLDWYLDLLSRIKARFPADQYSRIQPERVHPFPRNLSTAARGTHLEVRPSGFGFDSRAAAPKSWWTACASVCRPARP